MNARLLRELAAQYYDNREFITNEEMTKQSLIVPFIAGLGYNPANPREVKLEYTAEFTANDGKRSPDRMDYAIFDPESQKVLLVIEAKPLGTDVRARSPQLARYMSQLPHLRFGIITDGCDYLFYSDLAHPNVMDDAPFFSFSLADLKLDFDSVASFLRKFSKEQFKVEGLIADAEDSNYRQRMIDKLAGVLRAPESDPAFIKWLSDGVYQGLRRQAVLDRLARIAQEAVQPAIIRAISHEFLTQLRDRIDEVASEPRGALSAQPELILVDNNDNNGGLSSRGKIVTTEEELAFYDVVKSLCVQAGESPENIIYQDSINYFNVSYSQPTRWFLRFFAGNKKKKVVTQLPADELQLLAPGFIVEETSSVYGSSRVFIRDVGQMRELASVVLRALEVRKAKHTEIK